MRFPRACSVLVAAVALAVVLPASAAEETVPPLRVGKSGVRLHPPPGFERNAAGFEKKEDTHGIELPVAGVVVLALDMPIAEARTKLDQIVAQRKKKDPGRVVSRQEVRYTACVGTRVELDLKSSHVVMVAIGDEFGSAIVSAYWMGDRAETFERPFSELFGSLIWDPHEDTLPFVLGESRELSLRLTFRGTLWVRRPRQSNGETRLTQPGLTVAPFLQRPVPDADREKLGETLPGGLERLSDVVRGKPKAVTIGGLPGLRTHLSGRADGMRIAVVYWLLFDERGYFTLVGVCPVSQKGRWVPKFTELARSFRPKPPAHGK
jgi:hypothetical protein